MFTTWNYFFNSDVHGAASA